eukprot:m.103921 g.103921  ORF g.103921 m.103921 type:complete len:472 (-) comp15606_c1_seq3:351-1766(-)
MPKRKRLPAAAPLAGGADAAVPTTTAGRGKARTVARAKREPQPETTSALRSRRRSSEDTGSPPLQRSSKRSRNAQAKAKQADQPPPLRTPRTTSSPKNPTPDEDNPTSPTAGLRMLCDLASPQLRAIEEAQANHVENGNTAPAMGSAGRSAPFASPVSKPRDVTDGSKGKRRDKSLFVVSNALLAHLSRYEMNQGIQLEDVAEKLGIPRRRVYDVVNVLEGTETVVRTGKKMYFWRGILELDHTLAKLKALAPEQFGVHTVPVKGKDDPKADPKATGTWARLRALVTPPKDSSLGVLTQRFLMMFFIAKNGIVTHEEASDVLIFACKEQIPKARARRLYDIANVLCSLRLIDRTSTTIGRSKKPCYRWIGRNLAELAADTGAKVASTTQKQTILAKPSIKPMSRGTFSFWSEPSSLRETLPFTFEGVKPRFVRTKNKPGEALLQRLQRAFDDAKPGLRGISALRQAAVGFG